MTDTVQILPIIIAGLAAVLVITSMRSRRRPDAAVRVIRASLEETERQLEQLGWRQRSEQQDGEEE